MQSRCGGRSTSSRNPTTCTGGGQQGQGCSINNTDLATMVETAFEETSYRGFSRQINIPHSYVHVRVGCDMAFLDNAAYDPIFYLHHSYVDYQFAFWQELQRLRGIRQFNPDDGDLDDDLEPYNRNTNTNQATRRYCKGRDTFEYERNLCYNYDRLLYRGMTPQQFLGLETRKNSRDRIFAGITCKNNPHTLKIFFDVCRNSQCFPGGELDRFGSAPETPHTYEEEDYFPYKCEITKVVEDLGWSPSDKTIRLRVSKYTDGDGNEKPLSETYQPVVIFHGANSNRDIIRLHKSSSPTTKARPGQASSGGYPDKFYLEKAVGVEVVAEDGSVVRPESTVGAAGTQVQQIDVGAIHMSVGVFPNATNAG